MTLKKSLQGLLDGLGVYERLKASWMYDFYWGIADHKVIDDWKLELEFYRRLLVGFREGDMIFDIGANRGYKTAMFLRLGARVVAADPDETNQRILRQKFQTFRLRKEPLIILDQAVSEECSTRTMWIDTPGSAMNTLSLKWADTLRENGRRFGHQLNFNQSKQVRTTTIEQLVCEHGMPFFVKIDVEGHEVSVLRGMRRPVRYLSFEVNLPEFKAEGLECIRLLEELAGDGTFNLAADCRRGLLLDRWLEPNEFIANFNSRMEPCVEVFWQTPAHD